MARARKGKGVKQKLGFLIYGAFGTGKSTMALGFARMKREDGKPFRVLYLDPEAGSVDSYLDGLEEEIRKHILYKKEDFAKVVVAQLGNEAGIIGAALLGVQEVN